MPKASVIMTVYNTCEQYLKVAIESILNQTFKDFELIVVDDCSKNPIDKIVNLFNDNRIKLIRNEKNLGASKATDVGLDAANGEYIFRMDSDDISYPQRLEKQVKFLDENPDIDVVSTQLVITPKNQVSNNPLDDYNIRYAMIFSYDPIANACCAIRKSAIDKFGMRFETPYCVAEDYAFWLKYVDKIKFANLPEVLYEYRWHTNNASRKKKFLQSAYSQRLMFEAQGKYFNIDSEDVLKIVDRFIEKRAITSADLAEIITYSIKIKTMLKNENADALYSLNREFFKNFLKKCIKDIRFIKIIFSKEVSDLIKLSFFARFAIAIVL